MRVLLLPLFLVLSTASCALSGHFPVNVRTARNSVVSLTVSSLVSSVTASPAASPRGSLTAPPIHAGLRKMKHNRKMTFLLFASTGSLAIIILLCLVMCLFQYLRLSKKRRKSNCSELEKRSGIKSFVNPFNTSSILVGGKSVPLIEYKILERGSDNFKSENLLGKGGFGRVYKTHLEDNSCAAVKKLFCNSEDAQKEFENEVDTLSRIEHPNIISMWGYCVHEDMGFIVYELMQNGSLEDQLHGPSHGSSLSWNMRLKIALDTARGLEYLHEYCKPAVIHRDLKSSNILLDANFNAKLSDFGLAITNNFHNQNKLKLSGTVGYVAPEYMLNGELTEKSDVYAYGVVLLELLLGRRPIEKLAPAHCQSIVTWAMPQLTNRSLLPNIVDPVIRDSVGEKYLFQVAAVAVLCVQPEPSYRPLITDVVHSLIPLVPFELGGTLRSVQPSLSVGR